MEGSWFIVLFLITLQLAATNAGSSCFATDETPLFTSTELSNFKPSPSDVSLLWVAASVLSSSSSSSSVEMSLVSMEPSDSSPCLPETPALLLPRIASKGLTAFSVTSDNLL